MTTRLPNILFFHVDNLGMGELGCYGGARSTRAARDVSRSLRVPGRDPAGGTPVSG